MREVRHYYQHPSFHVYKSADLYAYLGEKLLAQGLTRYVFHLELIIETLSEC